MRRFDLLVAGELNPDVIVQSPRLELQFGQVERFARDVLPALREAQSVPAA